MKMQESKCCSCDQAIVQLTVAAVYALHHCLTNDKDLPDLHVVHIEVRRPGLVAGSL